MPAAVDEELLMVRMDVLVWPADRAILEELREVVRPGTDGETVAESEIVPEKPKLAKPRFAVAEEPAAKLRDDGLTDMAKSDVTLTGKDALWTREPLVPVIVTA